MELTRNEISDMIREAIEAMTSKLLTTVVDYCCGDRHMNLENCTNDSQINLLSDTKGEDQMAHRFQQRVEVIENGKKVIKWATGETQEKFQKSLFDILTKYRKYSDDCEPIGPDRYWDEYAQEWFRLYKEPNLKPKTVTTRKCFMKNYVVPAFGNKPISQITKKDIAEVLNQNRHLSKSYMRDIMNYMNGVFKAAVEDEIIRKNPMDSELIRNPCKREAHRNALTTNEQSDIIAHIDDISRPIDRLFMAFLMYTAMRPGEIFALRWEDIDFENRTIHVLRGSSFDCGKILIGEDGETKTGWSGVRMIPLHDGLMDHLLPMRRDAGFVFQRDRKGYEGEPFSEQAAKCQWQRIKSQIDVHGMTPYVGRHTYATEALHNGVTIDTAMKLLGHKDERMLTRHYLHTNDSHIEAANSAMEEYYSKMRLK